jgi:hypothetical protein
MEVEGVLDEQARLAGYGGEIIATVQELEMQVSGPVSRSLPSVRFARTVTWA